MSDVITISLCMIVKDESHIIEQCLQSVHDVVDEIIIMDTGSKDHTINICEHYHAKVYHYEWDHHFANARNACIEHATGDWILCLDADEMVDTDSVKDIRETLKTAKVALFNLPVKNYYGEQASANPNKVFVYYQPRLFRNHIDICFEGRIHETLIIPPVLMNMKVEYLPMTIFHYGYLEEFQQRKHKSQRNLKLLKMGLQENEKNPWSSYHLANELYRLKDYPSAFEYINLAILRFLSLEKKPPSLLYRLKYSILIETNNIEGAYPSIEKAIELYPDYVDLHYFKGLILYKKEDYKYALKAFESCLELGEDNQHYLILKGVGTFKAEEFKKKCIGKLNNECSE